MARISIDPAHVPTAPLHLRVGEEARARQITIAELARRSGLTRSLVERYYRDQTSTINLNALSLLAQALDVPAITLLTTTPATSERR